MLGQYIQLKVSLDVINDMIFHVGSILRPNTCGYNKGVMRHLPFRKDNYIIFFLERIYSVFSIYKKKRLSVITFLT